MSATIIEFPRPFRPFYANYMGPSAEVIVLPVVRVERPEPAITFRAPQSLSERLRDLGELLRELPT